MNLSVIIPVYNEAEHIREIVKRVQSTKLTKEIIIVDDGSEDGTRSILQELDGKKKVQSFCMNTTRARRQSLRD
jgi:glycosyltransferase involved in cell wall biosynthesis